MSESSQLVRQWKLLQMLESSHRGCSIQELMDAAEISDKTVRRDLKVLQNVFDITEITDDRRRKRWKMKPLNRTPIEQHVAFNPLMPKGVEHFRCRADTFRICRRSIR